MGKVKLNTILKLLASILALAAMVFAAPYLSMIGTALSVLATIVGVYMLVKKIKDTLRKAALKAALQERNQLEKNGEKLSAIHSDKDRSNQNQLEKL